MKEIYKPKNLPSAIGYLVEECGEVMAAAGKLMRWGPDGYNPELPIKERETNRSWLFREIKDLENAIELVRKYL